MIIAHQDTPKQVTKRNSSRPTFLKRDKLKMIQGPHLIIAYRGPPNKSENQNIVNELYSALVGNIFSMLFFHGYETYGCPSTASIPHPQLELCRCQLTCASKSLNFLKSKLGLFLVILSSFKRSYMCERGENKQEF
jgi:hypothetical protein